MVIHRHSNRIHRMTFGLACLLLLFVAIATAEELASPTYPLSSTILNVERIWLESNQQTEALKKSDNGILIRLPRTELEKKIEEVRAIEKQKTSLKPPLLIAAYYRASLQSLPDLTNESPLAVRDAGLEGSALWKVRTQGSAPHLLPLSPFSAALKLARFSNHEALVGDFLPNQPSILLPEAGDHSVHLDWTLRGAQTPEGLQFDWRMPPASIAILELDLPVEYTVSATPDSCLVTGPHPADQSNQRRWKIRFSGQSRMHLTLVSQNTVAEKNVSSLLVRKQSSRHSLIEGNAGCVFEMEVEARGPGHTKMTLECDPLLRPYQVQARQLRRYQYVPARKGRPALLHLYFQQPQRGLMPITVFCHSVTTPIAAKEINNQREQLFQWVGGEIRVQNSSRPSLSDLETLEWVVPPELRLQRWNRGQFTITEVRTDAQGNTHLHLNKQLIAQAATGSTRPRATFALRASTYRAKVQTWWQPMTQRKAHPAATVEVQIETLQGQLFELPILINSEWEIDRVLDKATGQGRNWTTKTTTASLYPRLTASWFDGRQSLTLASVKLQPATQTETLILRLRPKANDLPNTKQRHWYGVTPFCVPVGAASLQGGIGIDWESQRFQASLYEFRRPGIPAKIRSRPRNIRPAPQPEAASSVGPWRTDSPQYWLSWRHAPQPILLHLQPRRATLAIQARTQIKQGKVRVEFQLESRHGDTSTFDVLMIGDNGSAPWQWTAAKAQLQRKPIISRVIAHLQGQPMFQAGLSWQAPRTQWKIQLPQPLQPGKRFTLMAERSLTLGETIPVPFVENVESFHGTLFSDIHYSRVNDLPSEKHNVRGNRKASPSSPSSPLERFALVVPHAHLESRLPEKDSPLVYHLLRFGVLSREQRWINLAIPQAKAQAIQLAQVRINGQRMSCENVQWSETTGQLTLPLPRLTTRSNSVSRHRIELLFKARVTPWSLWANIPALKPQFPVQPLAFERYWQLPTGINPLQQATLQTTSLQECDSSFETFWQWLSSTSTDRAVSSYPLRVLREADESFCQSRSGQSLTLAEVLSQLAFQELQQRGISLIVDARALREQGIRPTSRVRIPSFDTTRTRPLQCVDSLGLRVVFVEGAFPILTTRDRYKSEWAQNQTFSSDHPLTRAARAAWIHGTDATGRFCNVIHWLDSSSNFTQKPAAGLLPLASDLQQWQQFDHTADQLLVIQDWLPTMIGLFILVVTLYLTWRVSRWIHENAEEEDEAFPAQITKRKRVAFGLLLIELGMLSLCWLWVPTSLAEVAGIPLLGVVIVAISWYLKPIDSATSRKSVSTMEQRRPPSSLIVAGMILLILVPLLTGANESTSEISETKKSFKIYLLGPRTDREKQVALITPELLAELKQRSQPQALRPTVLVRSNLKAEVNSWSSKAEAEIEILFHVHCSTAEQHLFHLPIEGQGLRLSERADRVMVDGARGWARPAKIGFHIPIKGEGIHTIRMVFTVPVQRKGLRYSLSMKVPRLAVSHLELRVPKDARWLDCPTRLGAQQVSIQGDKILLKAEQGAITPLSSTASDSNELPINVPLQLHWYQPDTTKKLRPFRYQESWLWNLDEKKQSLTGVLLCDLNRELATMAFHLPRGLLVDHIEVRRPVPSVPQAPLGPLESTPRLTRWLIKAQGTDQRLTLQFHKPVSGRVQLLIQLLSSQNNRFASNNELLVPLRIPRIENGESTMPGTVGTRTAGLTLDIRRLIQLEPGDSNQLPAFFWRALGERPGLATVYQMQPIRRSRPALIARMKAGDVLPTVTQQVYWDIHDQYATFQVYVQAAVQNLTGLSVLHYQIPESLHLSAVQGNGVWQWTRTGNRLTIWLRQAVDKTNLQLSGWIEYPSLHARTAKGNANWQLLPIGPQEVASVLTHVRVRAKDTLTFQLQRIENLIPVPTSTITQREKNWLHREGNYRATLKLQPVELPMAISHTDLRLDVSGLRVQSLIQLQAQKKELHQTTIELLDWNGPEMKLTPPPGTTIVNQFHTENKQRWLIEFPPGQQQAEVRLQTQLPMDQVKQGIRVPNIHINNQRHQQTLGLSKAGLRVETKGGVKAIELSDIIWPETWMKSIESQAIYLVDRKDWLMYLYSQPRLAGKATLEVVSEEHHLNRSLQQQWLHEQRWWLMVKETGRVILTLPNKDSRSIQIQEVRINGKLISSDSVQQTYQDQLHLTVKKSGIISLSLHWHYPQGSESLDSPELQGLRIGNTPPSNRVWSVTLPEKIQSVQSFPWLASGLIGQVRYECQQAEIQQQLSQLVESEREFRQIQERFFYYCQRAEHLLITARLVDSAAEEAKTKLQRLKENHLNTAINKGWSTNIKEIEESVRQGKWSSNIVKPIGKSPYNQGVTFWFISENEPTIEITSLSILQKQRAMTSTAFIILTLFLLWFVSRYSTLRERIRKYWPEQLAIAGLFIGQAQGLSVLVVGIITLATLARVFLLLRGLIRRLAHTESTTRSGTHSAIPLQ